MVFGETPDLSAAKEGWPQRNAQNAAMPQTRLELPQACFATVVGYCLAMSFQTLEVELDHGQVRPQNAEILPAKAQALLTILSPAAASLPPSRSLGEALRDLNVQGRGQFTDLSTNPRHLDDFGK